MAKELIQSQNIKSLVNSVELILADMNIGLLVYHLEKLDDISQAKLVFANHEASKYTATDLQKLVGKYIFDAFPSLADTEIPKNFLEVAKEKQARRIGVIEYSDANIRKGSYSVKAFPMPDDCFGVIFEDISLRKQVDEMLKSHTKKLQEKKDELESFISMLGHDLTSPLRRILSDAHEIKKNLENKLPESDTAKLNRIHDSASELTEVVDNLIYYSKIAPATKKIEEVDLYDIIERVLADLNPEIIESNAQVHVGELAAIPGVENDIYALFHKLIQIAVIYHREGMPPEVTISGKKLQDRYQVIVEDNGLGFDEQYAGKLYLAFHSIQGDQKEHIGTGVALATCLKIVERHNGTFQAKSKPGQGTTFLLTFPAK